MSLLDKRLFTVGSLVPNKRINFEVQVPTQNTKMQELKKATSYTAKKDILKKIVVLQSGKHYEIQPIKGQLLLDAALQQGQALNYKCQKGTCGECKVKVNKGAANLLRPNEMEQKKLKDGLSEGYRLACQSVII